MALIFKALFKIILLKFLFIVFFGDLVFSVKLLPSCFMFVTLAQNFFLRQIYNVKDFPFSPFPTNSLLEGKEDSLN